ncbi:MAG: GNAT family N-acetyltransferase [Actinocatenispora sp.]
MGGLPREDLLTARLRLRDFRDDDIPDVVDSLADPAIRRFLPQIPDPFGADEAADLVRRHLPSLWEAGGACFAVVDARRDVLLGAVSLSRDAADESRGEIGYWLARRARGHGYAAEAVAAVSEWALTHAFHRLELLTALDNPASQRVALATGYRREGIKRGAGTFRDGTRYDKVQWARLATDPTGRTPRLLPDLPGGELSDGVVALHPLGPDDAEDAYTVRQLQEVADSSVPPVVPSRRQVLNSCATAASNWLAGAVASLTIRDAPSDRFAGEITLMYSEPPTGTGMIGYHVAPRWRGRGFATRAVRLLSEWALHDAGLARLEAGVSLTNSASQTVLERAGFRRVGQEYSRRPGRHGRVDDYLYELVPGNLVPGRTALA